MRMVFGLLALVLAAGPALGQEKEVIRVPGALSGLPFSPAVRVGNLLFLSGQIGTVPGTRGVVPGGIEAETRQVMENIKAVLEHAGSSMERVVKCTVFLGDIADYETFLNELDKVWKGCFEALVPGGRMVVVVGDVCLSRKKHGRHHVIPLHADITAHCRKVGFDNLTPIFWYKIANASYEAEGNGAGFLGKPFEPNSVVKNDVEFILMLRKPGGYRSPSPQKRLLSVIPAAEHRKWFRQVWEDLPGESTKEHPAPYPLEVAERLVRMFSFYGDTVLDPFAGTGTTSVAASRLGRDSIGIEITPEYLAIAERRLKEELSSLHAKHTLKVVRSRE